MLVASGLTDAASVVPDGSLVDVESVGNIDQSINPHHEGERGDQAEDGKEYRTLVLNSRGGGCWSHAFERTTGSDNRIRSACAADDRGRSRMIFG